MSLICLFGPAKVINPDAMIPYTLKEIAFIGLGIGALFMAPVCLIVYFSNKPNKRKKVLNFILILIPAVICICCVGYIVVIIAMGFINSV